MADAQKAKCGQPVESYGQYVQSLEPSTTAPALFSPKVSGGPQSPLFRHTATSLNRLAGIAG